MSYRERIVDGILKEKLNYSGAILIQGAKWCGKTTTAEQVADSVLYMNNPDELESNLIIASLSPSQLLKGNTPRLIDEWQLAPKLWDAIRFEVDHRDGFGHFVLTGSAVPADLREINHSGTGQISRLTMRPMSLFESNDSNGEVSLRDIFNGEASISGSNDKDLDDIAYYICRGGWPQVLNVNEKYRLNPAKDYYDGLVNSDISRASKENKNPEIAKSILRALARSQGTQVSNTKISADIMAGERTSASDETVAKYINALKAVFAEEDVPAWNPNLRSKTAIRSSNTRYFVDPSIATAALGIGPDDLMNDLKTFGFLFETLCIRDLRVYSDALEGNVYHYRDKNGLECDAVVHLRDGRYGLIEIKLGGNELIEEGCASLNKIESIIDLEKMHKPAFKMVLIAKGQYAYKRGDGVYIVPLGCLRN